MYFQERADEPCPACARGYTVKLFDDKQLKDAEDEREKEYCARKVLVVWDQLPAATRKKTKEPRRGPKKVQQYMCSCYLQVNHLSRATNRCEECKERDEFLLKPDEHDPSKKVSACPVCVCQCTCGPFKDSDRQKVARNQVSFVFVDC